MDESGNTGTRADPDQPIHLIGCLIVEDVRVRPLEDDIAAIAVRHFGEAATQRRFELHGADLYSGNGVFRDFPPPVRIAAAKDAISAIAAHASAFGYAGVNKLKSQAGDHPHRIAFQLVVEGLQPWLKHRGALGLIVADENQEVAQDLIDDFALFKAHYTTWGYRRLPVENIVDSVHFVQSHNNRIIQGCDLLTFFFLKGHRLSEAKADAYNAIPDPKPTWPQWLKANCTRAESATLDVYRDVRQITRFRAKIWP